MMSSNGIKDNMPVGGAPSHFICEWCLEGRIWEYDDIGICENCKAKYEPEE